ncbi:hypothetical protein [Lentilactobacillus kribbianus]|uniref:hypothetical protein n=1 Tax=Lentilactobacillus kribbianus TaxID=2729622 RepID=UPI0015554AE5|nr:hypothetical protein [Lentilactobacillus kribbianus]
MKAMTKRATIKWIKQQFKRNSDCTIRLLTFKKDRMLTIVKRGVTFDVIEAGFNHCQYSDLDSKAAFHLVKKLLELEFPRSHMVYCDLS